MKVRFHTQTLYVEYKIRNKKKLIRERKREKKGHNEEAMLKKLKRGKGASRFKEGT